MTAGDPGDLVRRVVQGLVVAAGVAVAVGAVAGLRAADAWIYVAFVGVYALLALPDVEVLPGLRLAVPNMAVSLGFLYIAGLPVVLLRDLGGWLAHLAVRRLPRRWRREWSISSLGGGRGLFPELLRTSDRGARKVILVEWATFTIGLGVRHVVVVALADGPASASPGAIAVAELSGYAVWGLLSILPIYPDRPMLPLSADPRGLRAALSDVGLLIVLALTPFVFLITYGYQAHGLDGAVAWALSTLGLHFVLDRLNERRLRLEEQNRRLEQLNRELEHRERLSAIGKMSSVVSHQILQQLGVIGLYADLIRNAGADGGSDAALRQAQENAGAIETALGDVNRVLTDLLVFSRDLRLNLYEHEVAAMIGESVADCRAEAEQRGVRLTVEAADGVCARLDKLKLRQAITNVVRNAIEASPRDETVSIVARRADGELEIRVTDRGAGVSPAAREQVFTPFFTTKEHGTGLGLAIAREFSVAHGGHLEVEEPPDGRGASFVFRLPCRQA